MKTLIHQIFTVFLLMLLGFYLVIMTTNALYVWNLSSADCEIVPSSFYSIAAGADIETTEYEFRRAQLMSEASDLSHLTGRFAWEPVTLHCGDRGIIIPLSALNYPLVQIITLCAIMSTILGVCWRLLSHTHHTDQEI